MNKQESIAWMHENYRLAGVANKEYAEKREVLVRRLRLMADELESIDKLNYSNEAHMRYMDRQFHKLNAEIVSMRQDLENAQTCAIEARRIASIYDLAID